MAVAIRELGLRDQMMVEELLDSCTPEWRDVLRPGASGPLAFLADSSTFGFGAYVDDAPAGFLWGVHVRGPDGRLMTYVHDLDVVEAHRRRGLATALTEAAIGLARRAGSHELWLVTEADNHAANALYSALGGSRGSGDGEVVYVWDL